MFRDDSSNIFERSEKKQGFFADLAFGKQWEEDALRFLDADEIVEHKPEGLFKEYDFKTNKFSYEVKSDKMTKRTGNMFFEFESSNSPSGIMTTTADFWIYYVIDTTNRVYKIPTKVIEEHCRVARIVSGCENYKNRGYIVKESLFRDYRIW